MESLSERIADLYVKRNIIDAEEKDVYKCGLELIFNDVVTFCVIIIASAFLWRACYAAEFLLTFCLTRIFCGGYHAKKAYICRLTMFATFAASMLVSTYAARSDAYVLTVVMLAAFIIVCRLAPVRHPNKTLTEAQIVKNRKRSIVAFVFFATCAELLFAFISKMDGAVIAISLAAVAVLAVVGSITNERGEFQ